MFTEMFTPSLALTGQGVGFVAWNEAQFAGGCGQIWVNRNAAGVWSTATEVDTRNQALDPHIAANDGGDAIVVWEEREWSGANCTGAITGTEVWASRYTAASGTWSTPLRISVDAPPNSTIFAFSPVATLDGAGRAMVVWIQDGLSSARSAWYSRFDGTNWSAPALLSNGTRNSEEPTLALDGSGNVFALWRQDTNTASPVLANIWAARYDASGGVWSTSAQIGSTNLSGTDGTERPRLGVNTGGTAVAVWEESRSGIASIVAARFSSGTWSAPVPLEANAQQAAFPAVAIDVNGNAQAVWVQKIDAMAANNSGFTARLDGTTGLWGAPQLFEQAVEDVSSPQIGLEDSGRALIAWTQFVSGTPPVHAVHFTPLGGFDTPSTFPGDGVALAVNAGGTALLASEVTSFETTFFGISIRAAMFRP
jgi:hypothetical protein